MEKVEGDAFTGRLLVMAPGKWFQTCRGERISVGELDAGDHEDPPFRGRLLVMSPGKGLQTCRGERISVGELDAGDPRVPLSGVGCL
jgi:hypothetical protein